MIQQGYELNSFKANMMLKDFVIKGYYEVVRLVFKSDKFIYPDKLHNQIIKIAEKNNDAEMIKIINSKPAFCQFEDETVSDSIYEAKPSNKKIKHGVFKKFNSDGELSMSGSYQNNLLEGAVFELIPSKLYNENYSISNYLHGELDGLKTTFYNIKRIGDNVVKSKENYSKGKLNGVSYYYDISKTKVFDVTYENGYKNGNLKEWLNEKELISDLEFKNDNIWSGFTILNESEEIEKKKFDFSVDHFYNSLENKRKALKVEFENGSITKKSNITLPKNNSNVVDSGLDWLANIQEDSGCWDPGKYEGRSNDQSIIACTAFSLLTFLGAGHTDRAGKYRKKVKKACEWLISAQHSDGSFTNDNSINGICTMAIAEATGMGFGSGEPKLASEKACKFILSQQNASGGFNDFGKSEKTEPGEYDKMPPTTFCIMGLKSATLAGIQEKEIKECFGKTVILFNKVLSTGDMGESSKGFAWSHAGEDKNENTNDITCLAMALLARQYLSDERSEPWLKAAGKEISLKLPKDINSINYIQGYFQCCTLFQQNREDYDRFEKVYSDLLFQAQTDDEKFFCSWPKIFSGQFVDGGRIISTAFAIYSLEIHYRYKM
jgi:antitoxin component YwqK of YwqJK toxin-antitoxin module